MYKETEVKFHIADLDRLVGRLEDLGAHLISSRTHEYNLRFDTPARDIRGDGCVLRLRRDAESRLTFKGTSTNMEGVLSRREIEITVDDFDSAKHFVEALGYSVVATYEKYRAVYSVGDIYFMIDEMPYGDFLEIEGPDVASIREVANELQLDWSAAVGAGYLGIFRRLCTGQDLDETNLTFDILNGNVVDLGDILIYAADK